MGTFIKSAYDCVVKKKAERIVHSKEAGIVEAI